MLVRSCVPNCWVIFMKLPNCYMTFTNLHINILVWHTSYENPISTTAIICSERTNMHSLGRRRGRRWRPPRATDGSRPKASVVVSSMHLACLGDRRRDGILALVGGPVPGSATGGGQAGRHRAREVSRAGTRGNVRPSARMVSGGRTRMRLKAWLLARGVRARRPPIHRSSFVSRRTVAWPWARREEAQQLVCPPAVRSASSALSSSSFRTNSMAVVRSYVLPMRPRRWGK
jgi:hypothetical protein